MITETGRVIKDGLDVSFYEENPASDIPIKEEFIVIKPEKPSGGPPK